MTKYAVEIQVRTYLTWVLERNERSAVGVEAVMKNEKPSDSIVIILPHKPVTSFGSLVKDCPHPASGTRRSLGVWCRCHSGSAEGFSFVPTPPSCDEILYRGVKTHRLLQDSDIRMKKTSFFPTRVTSCEILGSVFAVAPRNSSGFQRECLSIGLLDLYGTQFLPRRRRHRIWIR